jgi:hypothetical protein
MNINTDKLSDKTLYFVAIEHGFDMMKLCDIVEFYKSKRDLIRGGMTILKCWFISNPLHQKWKVYENYKNRRRKILN